MKRTLVDLEDKDLAQLDQLARTRKASRAAVLREAVAEYLVKRDGVPAAPPKPLDGFGALKGTLRDGIIYQNKLRAEWEIPKSATKKSGAARNPK
jgi:hypothetical protein